MAPSAPNPKSDPKFTAVSGAAKSAGQQLKKHPPPAQEVGKAQAAAKGPGDDKASQAKAAQVEKMAAAKPGGFDKAAFIAAVKKAIAAAAPKNLDEADKFATSGKADGVKGEVMSKVTQGKETSAKSVKDEATKAPDPSVGKDKPVTPLAPEPTPQQPAVNGAAAMPGPAPAEQVNFAGGPAEVDSKMKDAEVTEEQLKKSNEPEMQGAVVAKKDAEVQSANAPKAIRQNESQALQQAQTGAGADAKKVLGAMTKDKAGALGRIAGAKTDTKSKDEVERAKISADINRIFDTTKSETEAILNGLDGLVTKEFDTGEAQARQAFTAKHKADMESYKDKRYSGPAGWIRWGDDLFSGLPAEANKIYDDAKALYESKMTVVISTVADLICKELDRAKARIAQGRQEIKAYIDSKPANLQKVAAEAGKEMSGKFDQLESDVDAKQQSLVDDLANKYVEARGKVDEEIKAEQESNKGFVAKAKDAVMGAVDTILKLKALFMGLLAKAASAFSKILDDPIKFISNFMSAVKQGFELFGTNILKHLKAGLTGWLFGALANAGIELPDSLDVKGILKLVGSILGLTWTNIKMRIAKIAPWAGKAIDVIESKIEIFTILATQGIAGLWNWIKEKVGDLKQLILTPIMSFIKEKIVTAGITWVLGMLNPAGALVKIVQALIGVVQWIMERGAALMDFVGTVIDSVSDIANGGVGGVPAKIEAALGKAVPLVISFLANLLGLGGISDTIKKILKTVQAPINKALDFVVKGALKLAGPLIRGIKGIGGKIKGKIDQGKAWVKGKAEKIKAALRGAKRGFAMKGAGHTLTVRPGMPRVVDLASLSPGPLAGKIAKVLGDVAKRKEAVNASRAKVTEILSKGKKAGKREQALLGQLDKYLKDSDELVGDVRQIDSLRAQIEALGPESDASEIDRLVTRLGKRLEIFGMRYNLQDLGPLTPPLDKDMGDQSSFKEFSWGRKKDFGTLEAEHITPGSILERLIGGWDPSTPLYTRTGSDSAYRNDTTLLVTKRIADIKTDLGSLRIPSDQSEIRTVKATLDRATTIWQKVDSEQPISKQERQTLEGLGELFNRVLLRRVEVTIAARDQYIAELRSGKRHGMPDAQSLAVAIKEIQARFSDGRIQQAALDQLGRAWTLGRDNMVRVPNDTSE